MSTAARSHMSTDLTKNDNYFSKLTNNNLTCLSKWRWSTVHLQMGYSRSCHRTDEDYFNLDNFEDFHNLPTQLQTRQSMLDGKWPGKGCEYCQRLETVGGISDRLEFNNMSYKGNIPPELLTDNKAIKVSPTLIEIALGNLCNMSCIYCGPTYSSLWEAEMKKFPDLDLREDERILDDDTYKKMVERCFIWLDKNIGNLRDLHILGGEPTLQPELLRLIHLLESHPDVKLDTFIMMSNMKVSKEKLSYIANKLELLIDTGKIKQVIISPSIDCWGTEQEYIRTGLNLKQTEENLAYLAAQHPRIHMNVHGVITALTLKTMPDLIEKFNQYNIGRPLYFTYNWNFVSRYEYFHPGWFPKGFFDADFDRIIATMKNGPIELQERCINTMEGYRKLVNEMPFTPSTISHMKSVLDKLDMRRKTDWRAVFPWLSDFDEFSYKEH